MTYHDNSPGLCLQVTCTATVQVYFTGNLHSYITDYFELEGIHKDHEVQLLNEWLIQGSNPQLWHYLDCALRN